MIEVPVALFVCNTGLVFTPKFTTEQFLLSSVNSSTDIIIFNKMTCTVVINSEVPKQDYCLNDMYSSLKKNCNYTLTHKVSH